MWLTTIRRMGPWSGLTQGMLPCLVRKSASSLILCLSGMARSGNIGLAPLIFLRLWRGRRKRVWRRSTTCERSLLGIEIMVLLWRKPFPPWTNIGLTAAFVCKIILPLPLSLNMLVHLVVDLINGVFETTTNKRKKDTRIARWLQNLAIFMLI